MLCVLQRTASDRARAVAADLDHQPSDEVKADWDLSGAVDDARVLMKVGYAVANTAAIPTWKPGTEFKAKRDSMMATDTRPSAELKKP